MVYNKKMLNVTNSGTYITIEATDEYQRFRFVNVEKFDADAYHGMGEYNVVRSLDDLTEADSNAEVTATAEGYFQGLVTDGLLSIRMKLLLLGLSTISILFITALIEVSLVIMLQEIQ